MIQPGSRPSARRLHVGPWTPPAAFFPQRSEPIQYVLIVKVYMMNKKQYILYDKSYRFSARM